MSTPDIGGVRNLADLLAACPAGNDAARLAASLGVWSAPPTRAGGKREYPQKFSTLSDDDLSDTNAYWNHELARSTELLGLLEGQRVLAALAGKTARYAARSAARTRLSDNTGKTPTSTAISDEAENDTRVAETNETAALLDMSVASVKAYKDACTTVVAGVSREISFRQDQYKASLRAR